MDTKMVQFPFPLVTSQILIYTSSQLCTTPLGGVKRIQICMNYNAFFGPTSKRDLDASILWCFHEIFKYGIHNQSHVLGQSPAKLHFQSNIWTCPQHTRRYNTLALIWRHVKTQQVISFRTHTLECRNHIEICSSQGLQKALSFGTISQPFKVGVWDCHRNPGYNFKLIFWVSYWPQLGYKPVSLEKGIHDLFIGAKIYPLVGGNRFHLRVHSPWRHRGDTI